MTTARIRKAKLKRKAGRKPGRPSTEAAENISHLIVSAAREVYGKKGYHETSVERILREAKVSRPTFYRHFAGRYDVVDKVVEAAFNELLGAVVQAVISEKIPAKRSQAGIRAYFNWCRDVGSIASALYGDVNHSESPAQKHRDRIVESLVNLVHEQSAAMGRKKLEPLLYDTLLRSIEHLGHGVSTLPECDEAEFFRRINVAERIMLAALAEPKEANAVPPLSGLVVE